MWTWQGARGRSRRQINQLFCFCFIANSPATSLGSRWAPYTSLVFISRRSVLISCNRLDLLKAVKSLMAGSGMMSRYWVDFVIFIKLTCLRPLGWILSFVKWIHFFVGPWLLNSVPIYRIFQSNVTTVKFQIEDALLLNFSSFGACLYSKISKFYVVKFL